MHYRNNIWTWPLIGTFAGSINVDILLTEENL